MSGHDQLDIGFYFTSYDVISTSVTFAHGVTLSF